MIKSYFSTVGGLYFFFPTKTGYYRILKCESEEEISKTFSIDLVPSRTLFLKLQTCFSSYVCEKSAPKYFSVFLLPKNELKFNNFLIPLKMHFIHLNKKTRSSKSLVNITQGLFTIWTILHAIILTVSIAKLWHRFKCKKMIFNRKFQCFGFYSLGIYYVSYMLVLLL